MAGTRIILTFFKVVFMAPVTPLAQCEPNPIEVTKITARTFIDQGTLELFVLAPSLSCTGGVMSLWASVVMMSPEGVLDSSYMATAAKAHVTLIYGEDGWRASKATAALHIFV